jgi:hypothetical protein
MPTMILTDDEYYLVMKHRRAKQSTREIPYNPAWTHGEIGDDEAALMEANGWRMRPDGSLFKSGS